MPVKPLNARERSFIQHFRGRAAGNATKAAVLAGYAKSSAHVTASRLLRKANVAAELEQKVVQAEAKDKANAEERDQILSGIARDTKRSTLNRIIAIKELNKVDGRHTVRHSIEGKLTLEMALDASRA